MKKLTHKRDVNSVEGMRDFALEFLKGIKANANGATVLCLEGDLGSGKTTFTQQVASIFNVKEHVTSPTFVLQKKYEIVSPLPNLNQILQVVHMDMYRIENANELNPLGFSELLKNPKNLLIIEWPEKVSEAIPSDSLWISFKFVDETTRRVQWY